MLTVEGCTSRRAIQSIARANSLNKKPINVLFLCTGNSARSIMAEVILNALGGGKFIAYSAGSHPTGEINPAVLAKLRQCGFDTSGLRSKSWDEFGSPDAPVFEYVITVCDNAANESCPAWSGSPVNAHWGIPDPAAVQGGEGAISSAFDAAYDRLKNRIGALLDMPLESMTNEEIGKKLTAIGGRQENKKPND